MHTTTPETLIAAVRARGNNATTLRDAAHEAHHAISAGLSGRWSRERIHAAVMAMGRSEAAVDEIMARAVEQIVCRDLGVDCGSVEQWGAFACIEAIKSGIAYPSLEWFVERVNDYMKSRAAREAADRVIALGVKYNHETVIEMFKTRGWFPNVNCDDQFNADDARNFAGWIVGQWLDCKHPGVIWFIEQWCERFDGVGDEANVTAQQTRVYP